MKISNNVEMLEISAEVMGNKRTIYPVLLHDIDNVILVDTGYPGQLPLLREAIDKTGIPFKKLNKVIITHHDIDHIGNLSNLRKELPQIEVLAHKKEIPHIHGEKPAIKIIQLEANLESLSDAMKNLYQRLKAGFESLKTQVDREVKDDETLPYCGSISVIFTPGHTPGHICLYLKDIKTLISGDLLAVDNGILVNSVGFANYDEELAAKSLKKLLNYDIEQVICYHGGLYKKNVNNRIKELAQ